MKGKRKRKAKLMFKLVFSYTLLIGLILCGFFAIESYNYIEVIFAEKKVAYEQKLDVALEQLNDNIQKIYEIHSQIMQTQELRELVETGGEAEVEAEQILSDLRLQQAGVKGIYLYNEGGEILEYATNSLDAEPDHKELEDFIKSKAYRRFSFQEDDLVYYGSFFLPSEADNNHYRYRAYIAIVLRPERLVYNMRLRAEESFDGMYFVDSGQVVGRYAESVGEVSEEAISDAIGGKSLKVGKNLYMVFRQRNRKYAEWEHVALVDYNAYAEEVWHLAAAMVGGLGIAIVCIIVISYAIAKMVTRPIQHVTHAMKQVEKGDYPPPLESQSTEELDDLTRGFNNMVSNLEKLNADIAREQEEKRKYEVATVKAQLELLQSQVNPHFIHNTLNGLKYMALTAGNRELAATITSFNTLLRASISTNTEFTTVEEECRYVCEYMNIQKMRYASRKIECTANVEPEAMQGLLPRLILQPLVENSLFHGILPMEDENKKGIIKIVCLVQQEFLHVYITDNGVGFPEEKLKKINAGELRVTNGYNHVGLNNVKERLDLMYRTDCKFVITSEQMSGTTIYFRVPYKEED